MANRHFGKVADVWKHMVLVEVLAGERPNTYAETHAGSASYRMVRDAERRFGVLTFLAACREESTLAGSGYARHLQRLSGGTPSIYPGSAHLAMLECGARAQYLLADTDPSSAADLEHRAAHLNLRDRVEVVTADGITAVGSRFLDSQPRDRSLVHMDPFDPHLESGGISALDLAVDLARAGVGLVYWYGYDMVEDRGWPLARFEAGGVASVWCGDVLVTDGRGATDAGGDLGRATTPGTGFGVVVANVADPTRARCTELGTALANAYRGSTLPDGRPGALNFVSG